MTETSSTPGAVVVCADIGTLSGRVAGHRPVPRTRSLSASAPV